MPKKEEEREEEQQEKKGLNPIMIIIIAVVAALVISGGVSFFLVNMLTSNIVKKMEEAQKQAQEVRQVISYAELIREGRIERFMLKGGRDVAVIDALMFKVGSDKCRELISQHALEVKEAIKMIFLSKTRSELTTVEGLELLKSQIKDTVNEMLGFVGEKENLGVLKVILSISAIASTE